MQINFNLWGRLSNAFGPSMGRVIGLTNMAATAASLIANGEWRNLPVLRDTPEEGQFDVTFKNGNTGLELTFNGVNKKMDGIYFHPPFPQFDRDKNICITQIDNSSAQVVENFGLRPYRIQLSGIAVDMSGQCRVAEMMAEISKLFEVQDLVDVEGYIYNDLDIFSVYFERLEMLEVVEGYPDTIRYKMVARACEPDSLLIQ